MKKWKFEDKRFIIPDISIFIYITWITNLRFNFIDLNEVFDKY